MDNLIIYTAKYLIFIIALIAIIHFYIKGRQQFIRFLISLVIAGIIAIILAKLAGKFYYSTRPFVSQNITPLIPHGADNGFPSEHTLGATAVAGLVYFSNRRRGLGLFGLAVLVGIARMAAHVHSAIDIVGGLILGAAAAWLARYLIDKYWPATAATGDN